MNNLPPNPKINKPSVRIIAYYVCPDDCGNAIYLEFTSKDQVPSEHPDHGTSLVRIVEVIETVLYDRDPTVSRKEGSNSAEESSPDQAE